MISEKFPLALARWRSLKISTKAVLVERRGQEPEWIQERTTAKKMETEDSSEEFSCKGQQRNKTVSGERCKVKKVSLDERLHPLYVWWEWSRWGGATVDAEEKNYTWKSYIRVGERVGMSAGAVGWSWTEPWVSHHFKKREGQFREVSVWFWWRKCVEICFWSFLFAQGRKQREKVGAVLDVWEERKNF